jgi:DNA-binding transcriptional MocR family regulator
MSACWGLQMPPTAKAVLMSLADNANDHGYCWPSLTTISARTCYSRSTVIEAIHWLEAAGLVRADRSNRMKTTYVVSPRNYSAPPAKQSGSRTSPGAELVREPDELVREPDTNRQEPSLPKSKKARESANGSRLSADWTLTAELRTWARDYDGLLDLDAEAEQFRDHWLSKTGADARKADWAAAWRTWVRNAVRFQRRSPNTGPPAPRSTASHGAPSKTRTAVENLLRKAHECEMAGSGDSQGRGHAGYLEHGADPGD